MENKNRADFEEMRNEMRSFDEKREGLIQKSREIERKSKKAIYCAHRGDVKGCEKMLLGIRKEVERVLKEIEEDPSINKIGAVNACLQEYAEAELFYGFVKEGKIPTRKEIGIDTENYLLGLCDFTGELMRRNVVLGSQGKTEEVKKIRDFVDEIFGEMLEFNFRNSELRRKFDSIKYNLNKIESVLYDLSIREK